MNRKGRERKFVNEKRGELCRVMMIYRIWISNKWTRKKRLGTETISQLISMPTETTTIEPKYIITKYSKTTRTDILMGTPIKITTIPTL